MGSYMVFDWVRAVLSPQYLELMPASTDVTQFFSDISDELKLTTALESGRLALDGSWDDILKAQAKLSAFLMQWENEEETALHESGDDSVSNEHQLAAESVKRGTTRLLPQVSVRRDTSGVTEFYLTSKLASASDSEVVAPEQDATEQTLVDADKGVPDEGELHLDILMTPQKNSCLVGGIKIEEPYENGQYEEVEEVEVLPEYTIDPGMEQPESDSPLDTLCRVLRINEDGDGGAQSLYEKKKKYEDKLPYKYFCSSCSFKSKRENHLAKHLILHKKAKHLYSCSECDFTTIRLSTLTRHQMAHSSQIFRCNLCPYRTDDVRALSKHKSTKHPSAKLVLRCVECQFIACSMRELRRHRIDHRRAVLLQCNQCGYKSRSKNHLNRHMNDRHTGARHYECEQCGRAYKRPDTLKQHRELAHCLPQHRCELCGRMCQSVAQLKEHLTVHSGLKPFLCEHCGACFKTLAIMRRHVRTVHTETRPQHVCSECAMIFESRASMFKHLRKHRKQKQNGRLFGREISVNSDNGEPNEGDAPITIFYCEVASDQEQ